MFLLSFETERNRSLTSNVIGQSNFKIVFQEDERLQPGTASTSCLKPLRFPEVCFLGEATPLGHI